MQQKSSIPHSSESDTEAQSVRKQLLITSKSAYERIRFLSRMSGGEASVRKGMERTRLREPALSQNKEARPDRHFRVGVARCESPVK